MSTEVEAKAPQSVADDATNSWLNRVEASVAAAHAALLSPERGYLPAFTDEIESASREGAALTGTPAMFLRLATVRERIKLLQSLLRQAAAFAEAREQETESVLGYTPRGLERAL
jgi:hypothetical protein